MLQPWAYYVASRKPVRCSIPTEPKDLQSTPGSWQMNKFTAVNSVLIRKQQNPIFFSVIAVIWLATQKQSASQVVHSGAALYINYSAFSSPLHFTWSLGLKKTKENRYSSIKVKTLHNWHFPKCKGDPSYSATHRFSLVWKIVLKYLQHLFRILYLG